MRTLSSAFRMQLMAESSDLVEVALLTIKHPALPEPLRLSTHPTDILTVDPLVYITRSRGLDFIYVPFRFTAPDDEEGAPDLIQIVLDNVNRETGALTRATIEPALVTLEIVSHDRPDLVEIEWPEFDLVLADDSLTEVTLSLSLDGQDSEPFPCDSFTPASHRGLF